jgi:hypothetical protein
MKAFLIILITILSFQIHAQRKELKWSNTTATGTANKYAGWDGSGNAVEKDAASPAGSTNSIQVNNGSGGFSGVGKLTSYLLQLDQPASVAVTTIPVGQSLKSLGGSERSTYRYLAQSFVYSGGLLVGNVLDNSGISDGSIIKVTANVSGVQTSGTAGASSFSYKLVAIFRKSGGVLTIVGSSTQSELVNDTGDSFASTSTLSVQGGSIGHTINLTTSKTFHYGTWIDVIIHSGS